MQYGKAQLRLDNSCLAPFLFLNETVFYFLHRLFANVYRFCFEDKGKTCLSFCKVKSARDFTKNLPLIKSSVFFAKTLHIAKSLPLRRPLNKTGILRLFKRIKKMSETTEEEIFRYGLVFWKQNGSSSHCRIKISNNCSYFFIEVLPSVKF